MTKLKKTAKGLLPAALVLLALVFAGVPAHAAEAEESDTTGTTEASVSFEAGKLKLENAPVLDFGSHAISHQEQAYEAVAPVANLQVSDLRGKGSGWDLYVSLSEFRLKETDGPTLKAASIHFTSPKVSAVNGTVGTPPAAGPDVSLSSDSTETLLWQAKAGAGMGVWSLGWDAANITLKVKPGTAEEGNSAATLTWSLQSAP